MNLPKIATKTYTTELPHSKTTVEYRPYLVQEERALLMANQSGNEQEAVLATINLVNSCVLTDGIQAEKLASVDLEWLFIHIRSKSVGEKIKFTQKCSNDACGKEIDIAFDVRNISMKQGDGFDPVYKTDIGDNDFLIIEFSLPTTEIYAKTSSMDNEVQQAFALIESCIESVTYQGNTYKRGQDFTQDDVSVFFGQLTADHFENISKQVFENAPKLYHEFNISCPHCKEDLSFSVEGLPNFFGS